MKTNFGKVFSVVLAATMCAWTAGSSAEPVVTETTTTSSGTIREFAPSSETVFVKTETSTEPVRYIITKNTTYVDETGAAVEVARIASGSPVTVHYIREGDRLLASRIVVRRAPAVVEERTVTTTTAPSAGTVAEFAPGGRFLTIRTEASPDPVRYLVSGKTIYVDETGAPVTAETIVSGVPVTIHYVRDADGLLASRIVVHRDGAILEKRDRKLSHDEREALEKLRKAEKERLEHERKERKRD